MAIAEVSPALTATRVVAALKPWSSAASAQTPAATSANWNSPRSFEISILGSLLPHVSVSVTPGTTNGWPSGAGTDTAPATADVGTCAATDDPAPSMDAANRLRKTRYRGAMTTFTARADRRQAMKMRGPSTRPTGAATGTPVQR